MANDNSDELISAYVDGQLSEPERTAFEARLQADTALRRRVWATQLLTREARQLSAVPVPRNFILPRDIARAHKPERARPLLPALVFRFGSIAAALVFVFLVGLDILQTSSSRTPMAAPMTAPVSAPTLASAAPALPTVAELASDTAAMTSVTSAPAVLEAPAGSNPGLVTVLPMATAELTTLPAAAATDKQSIPQSSVLQAETDSANGIEAVQATQAETFGLTTTPQPQQPSIASAPTPLPALTAAPQTAPTAPMVEQSAPPVATPLFTVPRALAAIALLLAIGLGIFGWARRE